MTVPAISIVVPVYNLEFYIERCLRSLAEQTLDNIQVIVVNDGGKDDSQMIIDKYVQEMPHRFESHIKENGGHGSACNYGIERAHGEYVMIVDGDDYLDPDTCEFMYRKAKEVGADILIGNLMYIFSDSSQPYVPIPIEGERMLDELDRKQLYSNWPTPCGRIYKRRLFQQDPELKFLGGVIFADANFVPKSYAAAERIYYVNKELYNYDITRPTQSLKQTDKRILNVVPVLIDTLEYHKKKDIFEVNRTELMTYTARHCVAWLDKIKPLKDYSRKAACNELFSVADRYFGNDWQKLPILDEHFGKRRMRAVRTAKRVGYWYLVACWRAEKFAQRFDTAMLRILNWPSRAYMRVASMRDSVAEKFIA